MASGFEGWISVFEDDWLEGTNFYNPQALYVDQENLSFNKEITQNTQMVGSGRVMLGTSLIHKAAKPRGDITFQFRSDDISKFLFAHFQNATYLSATAPFRYQFYPRTNPIDYSYRGTVPNTSYGIATGRPYTLSVLKKTFDTSSNGGTNAFFFKHGVCDKLKFSLGVGDDAKANAHLLFRDLDYGTPVSDNPPGTNVGSYSSFPSYQTWVATVLLNGVSFEVSSFSIESEQTAQEFSRIGKQTPENYQFPYYTARGNFAFDLPSDAMLQVGSMFGTGSFALVATLFNGTSDRVIFELPNCFRTPFDYRAPSGNKTWQGQIPFQAFESNGTFPLRITVDTGYALDYIFDAALGARNLSDFATYDASSSARTLSSFIVLERP